MSESKETNQIKKENTLVFVYAYVLAPFCDAFSPFLALAGCSNPAIIYRAL